MKRILFSVAALMFFTVVSNAQGFHLGAKAGANLGKIDGQSFKDGFNLGYQLGGFAEIDFTKGFGIQPELLFSQTNTTYTDEPLSGLKSAKDIHLNYLNVPILLRLNASKLLTFHVGPQFSVLVNDHKTTVGNAVVAFKGGDFAMVAGAQVNLGALKIYGRYNIGLSDIKDVTASDNWKSQQVQFGVGLRIL